ncbi:MAG: GAF domain-containing protein, partial [Chloroflexi bacterium]|nr:GAF domain-containing protein [Chloroflexota bacterium]
VASRRNYLETQAAERQSQKLAVQLATVSEVGIATSTILDVEELLQTVVDKTRQDFDVYHAHVYLLDQGGRLLRLAAGSGRAGRSMKARGHSIPMDRELSLVARAARTRQGVMANNVMQVGDYLPNPMLPETRSELAVPLLIGDELLGVLDVQSRDFDRFRDEDLQIQSTLAAQIAVAIQNARSFAIMERQAQYERETAERLREVDKLKSQFLANMSHELRTPLNSIIGYSEVLLDGDDGELSDDAVEDVQTIHGSGQHLLSIINDILDLAKIEAGQMRIDRNPVQLDKLLPDIIHASQVLIKEKPVTLKLLGIENMPAAIGDELRLRQIVMNILSNAAKFTEEGEITVSYGIHDAEYAFVAIDDTGIGISEAQLNEIFERFQQVDGSTTRRAGGTGLGLSITRHLVQLHGGDITAESELGVGSTFRFTVPLMPQAEEQAN